MAAVPATPVKRSTAPGNWERTPSADESEPTFPLTKKQKASAARRQLKMADKEKEKEMESTPEPVDEEEEGEVDVDGDPMPELVNNEVVEKTGKMVRKPTSRPQLRYATGSPGAQPKFRPTDNETPPGMKRMKSFRLEGGLNFVATFSETQLNYVNERATSYKPNKTLVSIGIAYAAYKQFYKTEADKFTKTPRFTWYHLNEGGGDRRGADWDDDFGFEEDDEALKGLPEPVESRAVACIGPTKPLHDDKVRVVLIRPQEVGPMDNLYVHLIYDDFNCVFVTPAGDCLYATRAQVCKKPYYTRRNNN